MHRVLLGEECPMPDFYTALSGLQSENTALNTVANNLSNQSTTGYKASTTSFASSFYEALGVNGAGETISKGTGVYVSSNSTDYSSGTLTSASSASDMAISGSGFFVLNDNGTTLLTRCGAFDVSSTGELESSSGYNVEGYLADSSGTISTSTLSDITIPVGSTMAAKATTDISFTANLASTTATGGTVTSSEDIYDSLGNSYTATVTYTKTGTNQWSYNIAVPETLTKSSSTDSSGNLSYTYNFGTDANSSTDTVNTGTDLTITALDSSGSSVTITAPTITSGETVDEYVTALSTALSTAGITGVTVTNTNGTVTIAESSSSDALSISGDVVQDLTVTNGSGTLTFDSSGNLTSPSTSISGISVSGLSDGASNIAMSWDLFNSSGTSLLTQTASDSSTTAKTQNGYASGTYESFAVDSDGVITATYSNDQTQTVGEIALATVNNVEGLKAVDSTDYAVTSSSGTASIGAADSDGRGTIKDEYLEESNVSVTTEFTNLVIDQRAFEADSKAIAAMDAIVDATLQIK